MRLGIQTSPPGYRTPLHSHPYMETLMILEGAGEAWIEGSDDLIALAPGMTLVFPAERPPPVPDAGRRAAEDPGRACVAASDRHRARRQSGWTTTGRSDRGRRKANASRSDRDQPPTRADAGALDPAPDAARHRNPSESAPSGCAGKSAHDRMWRVERRRPRDDSGAVELQHRDQTSFTFFSGRLRTGLPVAA